MQRPVPLLILPFTVLTQCLLDHLVDPPLNQLLDSVSCGKWQTSQHNLSICVGRGLLLGLLPQALEPHCILP